MSRDLEDTLLREEIRKLRLESAEIERRVRWNRSTTDDQRILQIVGTLSTLSVDQVMRWLAQARHRSHEDITLEIFSPGGIVVGGLAIYDAIMQTRALGITVVTRGIGYVASMAGVVLQAGTIRQLTPNTIFHIHEVSSEAGGGVNQMKDEVLFADRQWEICAEILSRRSEKWDPNALMKRVERRDWWMEAKEALDEGFVDEVV